MIKTSRSIFCILLSLFSVSPAFSQSGSVIGGGDATGPGGSSSYSIGQHDYQTQSNGTNTITQGLQQPYEISIITGTEEKRISLVAKVYPNPTVNSLTLSIADQSVEEMSYAIFNMEGVLIRKKEITSGNTVIHMHGIASGIYILSVLNGTRDLKSFRIIKNEN